jgi:hypothetical protein
VCDISRVDGYTPVFVSHHQFQILTGGESGDYLDLYTVGDQLLQVTGRQQLTVLTGPHTGEVQVGVLVRQSPPGDDIDGWDAVAEATLWCPQGRIWICGLMSDSPPALANLAAGRTGLLRVRVLARGRQPDGHDPQAPEHHQVWLWPVEEDTGFRSLRTDGMSIGSWTPSAERAAGWAMLRLVKVANPPATEVALRRAALKRRPADPPAGRVRVRRHRTMPVAQVRDILRHPAEHLGATVDGDELVLPAGDLEIRLRPLTAAGDGLTTRWRWLARPESTTLVPDPADSTVELKAHPTGGTADLVAVHHGVREPDAVLLGLIWDHLLDHSQAVANGTSAPPHPWVPIFDDLATRRAAQADAARRGNAALEARLWGGTPPSQRQRGLPANTIGLARLDRTLLDALTIAVPPTQRALAVWAVRQAYTVAGLADIDWIAPALAALEQGEPVPAPFDDQQHAWNRLWADQRIPTTTVTIPPGTPNCSQQAIAFPALHAAAHADPLAAAVDTVYYAALAYGDNHRNLLAAAATYLAGLQRTSPTD